MPGDYPAIIRSRGFSWHVANQAALVRLPSFSAGYHAKWSFYRRWVPWRAIPSICLLFPILRIFSSGLGHLISCLYPQFGV